MWPPFSPRGHPGPGPSGSAVPEGDTVPPGASDGDSALPAAWTPRPRSGPEGGRLPVIPHGAAWGGEAGCREFFLSAVPLAKMCKLTVSGYVCGNGSRPGPPSRPVLCASCCAGGRGGGVWRHCWRRQRRSAWEQSLTRTEGTASSRLIFHSPSVIRVTGVGSVPCCPWRESECVKWGLRGVARLGCWAGSGCWVT